MKKLSVIIVNYNVCHFLEQALQTVKKATAEIDAEIIVVDNNSVDGSVEMVGAKFPQVSLIANKNNLGFSKANNQAIRQAEGEYILLLNPDTVVEEDTLSKCCQFMDQHPEAGGLGVKMLDGKGNFLPESKRGLPSPSVAFYKVFGLSALFPKSKIFGRYHLGFLDKEQTHEVEILSGACMFLRKSVLDKIGLLDEDYFMYGEDIDLSYRIIKAGYKNYYYPEARIIHYKGESTKRASVSYVFTFYRAMIIFARKHFSSKNAGLFSLLINLAIYFRATLALLVRAVRYSLLPLSDAVLIYAGMAFLKNYWEENHKWVKTDYPPEYMLMAVPAYIAIWLLSIYFAGGYSDSPKPNRIIRGTVAGTILISAISNFLDQFRFSKALILLGGAWTFFAMTGLRLLIHFIRYRDINLGEEKKKRIAIVGNSEESKRVIHLLKEVNPQLNVMGYISPSGTDTGQELYLGSISQIEEITGIYKIEEIIFCSKDLPAHQIIEWMSRISNRMVDFKIVPDESNYVIGSNSKESQGDFYTINIGLNLLQKENLRNKRILDLLLSTIFLLSSPLLMWLMKKPWHFVKNCFRVLGGTYSWVGYMETTETNLPVIKKGVLNPAGPYGKELDELTIRRLNLLYARDYSLYTDLNLILRSFRNLG
ncbi:MAG: glycosyltransferase [Cytophagaceae bacterium]